MLLGISFGSRYTFVFLFSAHGNSKADLHLPSHPFPATCHGNQWASQWTAQWTSQWSVPNNSAAPFLVASSWFWTLPWLQDTRGRNWTQISCIFPRNKWNFLITNDGLEMGLRNVGFSHRITDSMAAESWQDSKTSPTSRIAFNDWSKLYPWI